MIRTLDTSMLNIPHSYRELAPLAAKYGMQAISIPHTLFDDPQNTAEETKWLHDLGLGWGLLPLPADFYHWDLTDEAFDSAIEILKYRAEIAEKIGTYETSILPYEDCCTVFLPKYPAIKPKMERILKEEARLDVESLIEEALQDVEVIHL